MNHRFKDLQSTNYNSYNHLQVAKTNDEDGDLDFSICTGHSHTATATTFLNANQVHALITHLQALLEPTP